MIETLCAIAFGFFLATAIAFPAGVILGAAIWQFAYREASAGNAAMVGQVVPVLEEMAADLRSVKQTVFDDINGTKYEPRPGDDFDHDDADDGDSNAWRGSSR